MWVVILITLVLIAIFIRVCVVFQDKIKFIITGQDEGFKLSEILLLWRLSKETNLDRPASLFYSVPALNNAISNYLSEARKTGEEDSPKVQDFLSKLYKYRTKIDIDHENRRGLESSKYLEKGQRLRIILKGKGVFTSEILNNGHEIIIRLPLQKNSLRLPGKDWVGQNVSVYLWRKGDAGYVFDTHVTNSGVFQGQSAIYLAQSNTMERAQKRRSVRSECSIPAHLYFINAETLDFTSVELDEGYRCVIEDISEDGAMVRVGGKGEVNAQIKLQFELDEKMIVMFGIVRAVEYNQRINQSRLHFECLHLEKDMKNAVLNYVYKILPDDKKEVLEAMAMTEQDERDDKADENVSQDILDLENDLEQSESSELSDEPEENSEDDEKTESGAEKIPKITKQEDKKNDDKSQYIQRINLPKENIDTDELAELDVEDFGE